MECSSYLVFIALSCFAPFSAALYDDKSDVINLTNANFKEKVLKSKEVWLVEFFAPWCAHCQKLAPEYSKAAAELKGTVNFGAVNCDNERNLAEQLSITGYPTIKIYGLDKKAPTEYQSMRTAEALKVAALDALNELMEGKEKKKKKKEPKVVMDIESDKAAKDADDSAKIKVETEKPKATKKKEPAERKDSASSERTKDAETTKDSKEPTEKENSELPEEIKDSESLSEDYKKEPAQDKATESSEDSKEPGSLNTESKKETAKKKETESLQKTKEAEKSTKGTEKGPAKQRETKSVENLKDTETSTKESATDEKVTDDSQQPANDKAPKESSMDSELSEEQSQDVVSSKKAEQAVKEPQESSKEQPKKDDTGSISATEEPKPTESPSATEEPKPTESAVIILTDENFNETVIQSEEPWLVEFYAPWCKHCQKFASAYEKIAANLKGRVSVGSYDCDAEEIISKIYSIGNFPTLKLFPPGSKEPNDVVTYELTDLTEQAIAKWISTELSQAIPAPNISQLTDQSVFDDACSSVQLCVISFLPHILDCNAACRNDYLKTLKKLGDKYKKTQWGWLWAEAGAQENLESVLDVGGAGYPAMAAVSTKKTRYASLRGPFSFAGIDKFLEALYMGGESTAPIKGGLPKIRENEEWDGKDGKMPSEDEDERRHEEL